MSIQAGGEALEQLEQALRALRGRGGVGRLLCQLLEPVRAYDARTRSDLAGTLRVYVESGGGVAATAERLFLHRNSVFYRLQRIEELSGIDARDRWTRLILLVAFTLTDPAFPAPRSKEEEP